MDAITPATTESSGLTRPVFISYATADRKQALAVCKEIEQRGPKCWISSRDVAPGENYQEAIVRSIRDARAMVLVFSNAANNSNEIKKELSLASRFDVPVLALRIEDVEPSDAFAYELSTRQWIDAFEGWDQSIDALVGRIRQISDEQPDAVSTIREPRRATVARPPLWIAALVALLIIAAGAWWMLRPGPSTAHSMTVRLAGFQLLSADLPQGMRQAVDSEIAAAFNADGVVGVSNAAAPEPGAAPAYALGGTIQREGDAIRVITRLTNERSGATLWSDTFNYEAKEAAQVPRHVAVDAGNVVRCGLFGASTYREPLPDPVLRDYMQFCQGHWDAELSEGRKALVPAQRVVAALPDFSWGWAGVAGAYWKVAMTAEDDRAADRARAMGREAADKAIAIDPKNSEALYIKSVLLAPHDWLGREALLKRAVDAQRLDCGCEHHQYGEMLLQVGRVAEAVDQLHQADDMLALYVYTPLSLANALVAAGKPDDAKPYFDAAAQLAPTADFSDWITGRKAMETGDVKALGDPKLPIPDERRAALVKAYRALASRDAAAKADAARTLLALPEARQDDVVARLLAQLGANHEAFELASRLATTQDYPGAATFWYRSMRGALGDPGFPAVARQLGLIDYWKKTGTRPDVCALQGAPAFCRLI